MQKEAASRFIDDNFEPDDRLAIVLIDRASGVVTQRIASAAQISSPQFQTWLKAENRSGRDVYVTWNRTARISFLLTPVCILRTSTRAWLRAIRL